MTTPELEKLHQLFVTNNVIPPKVDLPLLLRMFNEQNGIGLTLMNNFQTLLNEMSKNEVENILFMLSKILLQIETQTNKISFTDILGLIWEDNIFGRSNNAVLISLVTLSKFKHQYYN